MSKITVSIVIVVAVIAGVVLYSGSKQTQRAVIAPVPAPAVNVQKTIPTQTVPDLSKTTVNSDASTIDAQLKSLDVDTLNISQSIDDKPIDPTL